MNRCNENVTDQPAVLRSVASDGSVELPVQHQEKIVQLDLVHVERDTSIPNVAILRRCGLTSETNTVEDQGSGQCGRE